MEIAPEDYGKTVTIDRTVGVLERMDRLGISLSLGISKKDIEGMDRAAGESEDWEPVEVCINKGRIYPREEPRPGEFASDYSYGETLQKGERGLTPAEVLSMFKDNYFDGLIGVYFSGRPGKEELLFLDIDEKTLKACPLRKEMHNRDFPNHATAENFAFPTVKIPEK